jgi:hypothetical protein
MVGMAIVICIATVKLAQIGLFTKDFHWSMHPFYNDHTAYGAAIALFIPLLIGFFFLPNTSKLTKLCYTVIFCFLLGGLYFSYC